MNDVLYRMSLLIDGPFCYTCVQSLMKRLRAIDGVVDVKLNMVAGLLIVYSGKGVDVGVLRRVIEESGFRFLGVVGV